jgi:hypothetical protein
LSLKTHDIDALAGRAVHLCPQCSRLATHALIKRTNCPMTPKPPCKNCPVHCYHATFREEPVGWALPTTPSRGLQPARPYVVVPE